MSDGTQQTSQSSTGGATQSSQTGGGAAQGGGSTQTQQSQAGTAQQTQTATRPDWLPENFWLKDKNEIDGASLRKSYDELTAFRAAEDSKRLSRPQKAEDYKVELSKNFKPPQGVEFALKADDPAVPRIQAFALKHGLSQDAVHELADEYAGLMIGDQQSMKAMRDAEIGKLGATASARVDAITTWLKANGLEQMNAMLVTAGIVEGFEKIISKVTSQGGAQFSQQHRDQQTAGKLSQEEYDKLTPAERVARIRANQSKAA